MKNNIINYIITILISLSLLFFLLWNILEKNISVNTYNPLNDITESQAVTSDTLEQEYNIRSWADNDYDWNTYFDNVLKNNNNNEYISTIENMIINNKNIDSCYSEFSRSLDIDNCIKDYSKFIKDKINVDKENLISIYNSLCEYWQNSSERIDECIEASFYDVNNDDNNFINCYNLYDWKDENKLNTCYEKTFDSMNNSLTVYLFLWTLMDIRKDLYKIDNNWRITVTKMDSKMLENNPQYQEALHEVMPLYNDIDFLENEIIKSKTSLYQFLKTKIDTHNEEMLNLDTIYKYSKYYKE